MGRYVLEPAGDSLKNCTECWDHSDFSSSLVEDSLRGTVSLLIPANVVCAEAEQARGPQEEPQL